jgi:hypothetical protein
MRKPRTRRPVAGVSLAVMLATFMLAMLPAGAGPALASARGLVSTRARSRSAYLAGITPDGRLGFTVNSAVGSAQGPALTATMPGLGGDFARLHTLGTVGVSAADGHSLWQRSADSLYADWHVSFPPQPPQVDPAPQVPTVTDPLAPAVPQLLGSADTEGTGNVHPVAAGYLAGTKVPVVAVSETVGVMLGGSQQFPFSVPGSKLHYGSFVTVLDGRTGRTLYHELDPGYVTQLAITGGRLVLADETGYPLSPLLPMGAWRSVTTVRALSFRPNAGELAASTAWSFSTKAPWAAVFGLQPVGPDVAFTWSDTPEDLGVPGPPDGHVVMVDRAGRVRWDVPTAGYPVLSGYDTSHRLLVIAEQNDPTMSVGYTLAGLRTSNGSAAVSVRVPGLLPTAMAVSAGVWYSSGIVTGARPAVDDADP